MTTPTTKPVPSEDPRDLLFNAGALDRWTTDSGYSPDRFGKMKPAYITAIAELGFNAPIAFASGINADSSRVTVEYSGDRYFARPDATPFITTGVFNSAQWSLFNEDFPGSNVPTLGTYSLLQAYAGAATLVYVAGRLNDQDRAAGVFAVDEADTTSADNGGTILVDALGRRWKRQYSGNINAAWFGFSESATGVENQIALQNAINFAKIIKDTILVNKYIITTSDVQINPGVYTVANTVLVYSGVRVIGSGQSNTLINHTGNSMGVFLFSAIASEYLYNTWVMDLAINGAGKLVTDTVFAVRADRLIDGLAIYGCGVLRCLMSNCYEFVSIQNSWTFEVTDCEMYNVGRNFIRALNITAGKIVGNRMDQCGEDGLFLTYSSIGETVALLLENNVIQGCKRRAVYGRNADHVMFNHNYIENCNQDGGYPNVEFENTTGTNSEMYSFVGGWIAPSTQTGQPAIKIDKARMVTAVGMYIRGSAFTYGFELGDDVEGYSIFCDASTSLGLLSANEDKSGISSSRLRTTVSRLNSESHTSSRTSSNASSSLSVRTQFMNCTAGGRVFTLLDAHLQSGRVFTVQKEDGTANNLVIQPEGGTFINGANSPVSSSVAFTRAEIVGGFVAGTTTPCWYVKFI